MIKHRLVFSYYIGDEFTEAHQLHLFLLNLFIDNFDVIDFILLLNNEDQIEPVKSKIREYVNRPDINFIFMKNHSFYREGLVYKTFIVDRLNEFEDNELVFFAHTKGVSNKLNKDNEENTKKWIALLWWTNLYKIYIVENELLVNDNVCYGGLYNYDSSSLTKYKWQYTGSFQWINAKRLYELTKNDDTLYLPYKVRIIAEEYLGNNVPVERVAFANHDSFNKTNSFLLYENSNYPYKNITFLAYNWMSVDDAHEFIDFIKKYNIADEVTIDI